MPTFFSAKHKFYSQLTNSHMMVTGDKVTKEFFEMDFVSDG